MSDIIDNRTLKLALIVQDAFSLSNSSDKR